MHNPDNGTALTRNVSCSQCHNAQGTDYHQTFSVDHTYSAMDTGCQGANCHSSQLVAAHQDYVGTGNRYPQYKDTCALCHLNESPTRIPATATSACSSCHTVHADMTALHAADPAADFVSIGINVGDHSTGDGEYRNCSDCHITNLLTLHVNNCGACHASGDSNVNNAVQAGNTSCTACHPTQHYGENGAHYDEYYAGNYNCGSCHGSGCYCHSPHTPNPVPSTISDAKPAYEGDARITLTASDGETGEFGIKATYYILDGGATMTGKTINVAAPTSGSAAHSLQFWSTDWSGNTETRKTVTFTVSKDTVAPVTTSDAKASYVGPTTIRLTATDGSQAGVRNTYYTVDGSTATSGTTIDIPQPASGTVTHNITFWSVDAYGNAETPKPASFTVTADLVAPTSTPLSSSYYRSAWTSFSFGSNDPFPSSGLASYHVLLDGLPTNVYGPYSSTPGQWYVTLYMPTLGTHTVSYWAKDNAGNIETAKTVSITYDGTAPTTTSNAVASYLGTATITLTATDNPGGSGVAQTRYRYYNVTRGVWAGYYYGTTVVIPPPASGSNQYRLYFASQDIAGNWSGESQATFTVAALGSDVTPPTGTMSVNSGAATTNSVSATVNSSVTDNLAVTQMRIDPGTGTYGGWITYASTSAITLPASTGTKTVRAEYRDAANNVLSLSDTILLDITAPTTTSSVLSGQTYSGAQLFTLSATDVGAGVASTWWQLDGTGGTWTPGTSIAVAAPTSGTAPHTLYFYSLDAAGNTEVQESVSFTMAATGPGGTGVTSLVNPDSYTFVDANQGASGEWATYSIYVNDILIGTKQASADPTWLCPQLSLPSGGHIDIVVDLGFTYYDFLFNEGRPNTYTVQLPAGATGLQTAVWTGFPDKNVVTDWWDPYDDYCTWVDIGPFTIGNIVYGTGTPEPDTTAPTGSISVNAGATYATTSSANLTLSATDTGGSGLSQMRFSNDGTTWSAVGDVRDLEDRLEPYRG